MSTLEVSNLNDGTTTVGTTFITNGSAKVWVNFNGTGTIAARDSHNVSSLTDNGTGDYNINFSNNMSNSDYYVGESGCTNTSTEIRHADFLSRTASLVQLQCRKNNANDFADAAYAGLGILGDLA